MCGSFIKRIYISRHVRFKENEFLFQAASLRVPSHLQPSTLKIDEIFTLTMAQSSLVSSISSQPTVVAPSLSLPAVHPSQLLAFWA